MRARRFNSIMPRVNEKWVSRVLGMELNPKSGPDLVSEKAFAEVKFSIVVPKANYPQAWTIQDHQIAYSSNGIPCYWALGQYKLDRSVESVPGRTRNHETLESMVTARILYIVPWHWMNQYPASNVTGQTHISKWDNTFRYPKLKEIPRVTTRIRVNKGVVCLTEGTNPKHFDI